MIRIFLAAFLPLCACAADISGDWNLRLIRFGEEVNPARITLKTEGTKVTGTLNELKIEGTIEGDQLKLSAKRPNGSDWGTLTALVQGDDLAGSITQGKEEFGWKAHRAKALPASPTTHTFEPVVFQRVFAGSTPVLHINPGDTVKTKTVDAGGSDSNDVRRSLGGNPETGPFYVEGAMPGDTLAVKLTRLRLNRDIARSGDTIVPSALGAGYYRDAKFDQNFDSEWKLDRNNNTAGLAKPTAKLKNFRVTLRPMLGCVGVAPPNRQSFSSGWLGSWGGNMDYNEVREGVTIYLPVHQEGALLFVGDGHALEGDGELNGDALETSMDVEFTVQLLRGQRANGPRFENDEFLMASGIAGSLQDAFRQATTELAQWLERDYKLSANESNIVLGSSIRYDIAEVVDPQIHVVAKIAKSVLTTLR